MIEKAQDSVGVYYMQMENYECFDELFVFLVELPVLKQKGQK